MIRNIGKTLAPVAAGLAMALAVVACGGHGSPSAAHSSDAARVQAVASSSQGVAAKQDAAKAAEKCQPKGTSTSAWEVQLATSHTAREAFYGCEHMTPAQKQAAGTCTVSAARQAIALPAGTARSDRETVFFTALGKCVPA